MWFSIESGFNWTWGLVCPVFLRSVPAQLFAHLSRAQLVQGQHDFTASEPLNYHGDTVFWRWSWWGEPWWMRSVPLWNNRSPGVTSGEPMCLSGAASWERMSLGCNRTLRETVLGVFYLDSSRPAQTHGLWSGVRAGLLVTAAGEFSL